MHPFRVHHHCKHPDPVYIARFYLVLDGFVLFLLPLLPIVMADGEASKAVSLLFRIAALVLSVAAAAVMGTASQLVVVDGDRGAPPSSYAVSYSQYNALK